MVFFGTVNTLNEENNIRVKPKGESSSLSTLLHQLSQQPTPFLPEEVGARQTAISADHAQVGDAVLHQVVSCLQTSLVGAELFTAGAANNGPTLMMIMYEYENLFRLIFR